MSEPNPTPGPRSRELAEQALALARSLTEAQDGPAWGGLTELEFTLDLFHQTFFEELSASPACSAGCSNCCTQMVFDVHAFEVERIGRRLQREGRAHEVAARCEERELRFRLLDHETARREDESEDDRIERAAVRFWSETSPCPLLSDDGRCSVHDIRPWSCRRFFAFNDPALCTGDNAYDPARKGIILEPTEDFDRLFCELDEQVGFVPDTDRLDLALARWLRHHDDVT